MEHRIIWAKPSPGHRDGKGFIVLCELLDNEVTPYVTWHTPSLDPLAPREMGHYHRSYEAAKEEFLDR